MTPSDDSSSGRISAIANKSPSYYGEPLSIRELEDHPRSEHYGPKIDFICPECIQNFGTDATGLGVHLINEHEPFDTPKTRVFAKPIQCRKGCGRWLEMMDGENLWHERLCTYVK